MPRSPAVKHSALGGEARSKLHSWHRLWGGKTT